jgi:hypothetical protein
MLILNIDKVVCFDTLLQVVILKDLECTKIVQNARLIWGGREKKTLA